MVKVFRGRAQATPSEQRSATFTGTVWADPIMPATENVMVGNVFFSPGARTHWHTHDIGQVLNVLAGRGFVCREGEEPQEIRAGDVVWISANERHWHGAAQDSYMIHMAISIGKTNWAEQVADADYVQQGD